MFRAFGWSASRWSRVRSPCGLHGLRLACLAIPMVRYCAGARSSRGGLAPTTLGAFSGVGGMRLHALMPSGHHLDERFVVGLRTAGILPPFDLIGLNGVCDLGLHLSIRRQAMPADGHVSCSPSAGRGSLPRGVPRFHAAPAHTSGPNTASYPRFAPLIVRASAHSCRPRDLRAVALCSIVESEPRCEYWSSAAMASAAGRPHCISRRVGIE